ncbi:MAG: hypothetical protein ACPG77_10580 [Nannocystaceae bacterium]
MHTLEARMPAIDIKDAFEHIDPVTLTANQVQLFRVYTADRVTVSGSVELELWSGKDQDEVVTAGEGKDIGTNEWVVPTNRKDIIKNGYFEFGVSSAGASVVKAIAETGRM